MNEKAVQAIQHVTTAALADDSETAVMELDKAGELIDELVDDYQDGSEGEEEEEEEADDEDEAEDEEEVEEDQPEDDESEGEGGGVRANVGEKVRSVKDSVPTPQTPVALAGLGVIAALAFLGALKALSGGEE